MFGHFRKLTLAIAAFALLFSSVAFAIPGSSINATMTKINSSVLNGELDYETGLLYRFIAAFEPEVLPVAYISKDQSDFDKMPYCGTELILEASANWDNLSTPIRNWIQSYVEIPNINEIPEDLVFRDEPKASAIPYPNGYSTTNSYQTDHFNIKYGNDGSTSFSEVERLGEHLEKSWAIEVVQEGYPAPTATSSYLMDIFIGNTGDSAPQINFQGAYTTIYDGNPYMAYIVIHPDIIHHAGASEEIAAHEFFHTIQFGLAIARGYNCYSRNQDHMWLWEATAVWMEDVVYPNNNSYVNFVNIYIKLPHESLHSMMDFYYQYSRAIFFKYIQEYYSGTDAVHTIWTACNPQGPLVAIDNYLEANDSSLTKGFVDFMNKNATMDYVDGKYYDDIELLNSHDVYPVYEESVIASYRPRYLGSNFIELYPDLDEGEQLTIAFDGDDKADNKSVNWEVGVVLVKPDGEYDAGKMSLNDDNEGELEISGFGSTYSKAYMIPTVTKWSAVSGTYKGVDYRYGASLSPSSGDDDDDNDDDASGDDDDDDDDGCGA